MQVASFVSSGAIGPRAWSQLPFLNATSRVIVSLRRRCLFFAGCLLLGKWGVKNDGIIVGIEAMPVLPRFDASIQTSLHMYFDFILGKRLGYFWIGGYRKAASGWDQR